MKIIKFTKFEKRTLRGFCEVELPSGMCIRDLTYHVRDDGSRWVGYPSKQYEKQDGGAGWTNQIWFEDKSVHYEFQKQLLNALDDYLKGPKGAQDAEAAEEDPEPYGAAEGDLPF
jgi:hypothetical protein